jgi:hypothetical protein
MKAGRTLQSLAAELDRQNRAKRDFIVSSDAMRIEDGAELFSLTRQLDSGMRDVEPFNITGLFHRQVGAALKIPAVYYDRMRSEYPDLLAQNVNGWFGRNPSRHMVRTMDGNARAFLSNRYRRIDNAQIAEAVLPVIGEIPDARVESCEVTENRLYLKVVAPRIQMDVVPGDTVQAGIIISNSEVGLGSVSVMPLIYRLVCSNGMVVSDAGQRKNHVGRVNDESWELFSDETVMADDRAFMMKLRDIVCATVDTAKFAFIVGRMREAAEAKITAPISNVIELSARQFGLRDDEKESVLEHLIRGGDLSAYGLSGAITRAAQDVDSYDRSTELERIGWQVITVAPNVWRDLNGAGRLGDAGVQYGEI